MKHKELKKGLVLLALISSFLFLAFYAGASAIRGFEEIMYSGNLLLNATSLNITNSSDVFMTIDQFGKVGIGTTSPSGKLHVESSSGNQRVHFLATVVSTNSDLNIGNSTGGNGRFLIGWSGASNYAYIDTAGGVGSLALQESGGNVGIGTTSPQVDLHINNTSPRIRLEADDTTNTGGISFYAYRTGASQQVGYVDSYWDSNRVSLIELTTGDDTTNKDDGTIRFYTASDAGTGIQPRMTIDNTGNVGIGTTSPVNSLHVKGDGSIRVTSTTGDTASDGLLLQQGGVDSYLWNYETGDMYLGVDGSTDLTILTGGNVGIGKTVPSYSLDVVDNSASGFVARFNNTGNDANRFGIAVVCGANTPVADTWNYPFYVYDGDGTITGYIRFDDDEISLVYHSDERLKKNIRDTSMSGMDLINNIKIRDYQIVSSGSTHTGVVADELEVVLPGAVDTNPIDGLKGVAKDSFIFPMIKGMQEQQEEINRLKEIVCLDHPDAEICLQKAQQTPVVLPPVTQPVVEEPIANETNQTETIPTAPVGETLNPPQDDKGETLIEEPVVEEPEAGNETVPSETPTNSAPIIDSYIPEDTQPLLVGEAQEFTITPFDVDNDILSTQWYVNNIPIPNQTSNVFTFTAEELGEFEVKVLVTDNIDYTTHKWTLTVTDQTGTGSGFSITGAVASVTKSGSSSLWKWLSSLFH